MSLVLHISALRNIALYIVVLIKLTNSEGREEMLSSIFYFFYFFTNKKTKVKKMFSSFLKATWRHRKWQRQISIPDPPDFKFCPLNMKTTLYYGVFLINKTVNVHTLQMWLIYIILYFNDRKSCLVQHVINKDTQKRVISHLCLIGHNIFLLTKALISRKGQPKFSYFL